jgi:hypothetical protein
MGNTFRPESRREFLDEQGCLREPPLGGHEHTEDDDEYSDRALSLLEENARLRGLVVKLTDIILRNVAEQG